VAHFYANENFPLSVVEELRRLGHDVLTVQETGKANESWPDKAVLEFATNHERTILTLNRRHFIRLHLDKPDHRGIVVCTFDSDFLGQANRIHQAVSDHSTLDGLLLRVNRPGR
jgi:hypothetical protein